MITITIQAWFAMPLKLKCWCIINISHNDRVLYEPMCAIWDDIASGEANHYITT